MATITDKELSKARQKLAKNATVTWKKKPLNDSVQAVVDLLQTTSSRNAVDGAIEDAAPGIFTNPQKKIIFSMAAAELSNQEDS